jgi:peptidyl-prolyl cis-trans isomerase B (cyclophilin B)
MNSNGGVMMSVLSGTWVNSFRRGMVVFGLMAMLNVILIAVALAEEPPTEQPAPHVILKTKFGEMEIVLFPDLAPKHVESFLKLAKSGFYNGTIFHRILPGFMIQGGDPLTKDPANRNRFGTGGPGYTVPAEFSKVAHEKGILSAARTQDPNSAGSQFFIMVDMALHLDGQYTVFGEVVKGVEVAETIVSQPRDLKDNPVERIEMTIEVMK